MQKDYADHTNSEEQRKSPLSPTVPEAFEGDKGRIGEAIEDRKGIWDSKIACFDIFSHEYI